MRSLKVTLTGDLIDFIADQIKEGGYKNQSEVVGEGLRLLRLRNAKIQSLRAEIDAGLSDVENGKTKPFSDALLRDIAGRARRNHESSGQGN